MPNKGRKVGKSTLDSFLYIWLHIYGLKLLSSVVWTWHRNGWRLSMYLDCYCIVFCAYAHAVLTFAFNGDIRGDSLISLILTRSLMICCTNYNFTDRGNIQGCCNFYHIPCANAFINTCYIILEMKLWITRTLSSLDWSYLIFNLFHKPHYFYFWPLQLYLDTNQITVQYNHNCQFLKDTHSKGIWKLNNDLL